MTVKWGHAASIILVSRQSRRVLLLRRGDTAAFMPGAAVFPGGVCAPGESSQQTALRELFEETGILALSGGRFRLAATDADTRKLQDEVNAAGREGVDVFYKATPTSSLASSSLLPWSTWLTPNAAHYRRRYYTAFHLMAVDEELAVRHCDREMSGHMWAEPAAILEEAREGKKKKANSVVLPPPQVYELSRLAKMRNLDTLPSEVSSRVLFPQTLIAKRPGAPDLLCNVLPGDQLYVEEPEGQYEQGTREIALEALLKPDQTKPIHRITYSSDPLYTNFNLDIRGLEDFPTSRDSKM